MVTWSYSRSLGVYTVGCLGFREDKKGFPIRITGNVTKVKFFGEKITVSEVTGNMEFGNLPKTKGTFKDTYLPR